MESFDYIVVGAGAAGCVVANRLSEDSSASTLLVEAGPASRHPYLHIPAAFPRLFNSRFDWADWTVPQPALDGRRIFWPRGKVIGGSSAINAMMWIRGLPADYDAWRALAGSSWGYQEVLPYFLRVEGFAEGPDDPAGAPHGVGGPVPIRRQRDPRRSTRLWIEAAKRAGLPVAEGADADSEGGVALAWVNERRGRRWGAAEAYLSPARRRPNLTVRTEALCLRVSFDERRATGVELQMGGETRTAFARREVILSAGTVGSAQLLLCSGVGPADQLRRLGIGPVVDSADVGGHLQDHLTAGVALLTSDNDTLAGAERISQFLAYAAFRRGMLTSNIAEGYGYLRSDPQLGAPDLELLFVPALFVGEGLVKETRPGITLAAVLLQPESRGRVAIESPSTLDKPIIDPMYLSDPGGQDRAVLEEGVRRCLQILDKWPHPETIGTLVVPEGADRDAIPNRSVAGYSQTLYHPVGTCRMGAEQAAVVDPELRVRGVERLRVIDASVMPRIVRGHTHAATLMIAERGAEFVHRSAR